MSSIDYSERLRVHPPAPLDPAVIRRAQLYVCGVAHDAADARVLLEALGLVEPLVPGPKGRRTR